MNENFKTIKNNNEGKWTKVINFLFSWVSEEKDIFDYDNVIFVNLTDLENPLGGEDIAPFGMDYVKFKILIFRKFYTYIFVNYGCGQNRSHILKG